MKVVLFCLLVIFGLFGSFYIGYSNGLKNGDQSLRERNQSLFDNLVKAHSEVDTQRITIKAQDIVLFQADRMIEYFSQKLKRQGLAK